MIISEGDIITISGIISKVDETGLTITCPSGNTYSFISPLDIKTLRPGYKKVELTEGIEFIVTGGVNMKKIVEFADYCNKCKYKDIDGVDDPCNECLNTPVNEDSHKPINFEEE